jgi:hypothetical protein
MTLPDYLIGSTVTLIDMVGRTVYTRTKAAATNILPLEGLSAGIYSVVLWQLDGTTAARRLVVR